MAKQSILDLPPMTASIEKYGYPITEKFLAAMGVIGCDGCALRLCDNAARGQLTARAALKIIVGRTPSGTDKVHIPCNALGCDGVDLSLHEYEETEQVSGCQQLEQ